MSYTACLQLEILAQPLLRDSEKHQASLAQLHKNLACAYQMGAKRILLRLSQNPFQQFTLSSQHERAIIDEIWPFLEPYQCKILVESWHSEVIQYAIFKGAAGFYDLRGLNDADLLDLAIRQDCTVIFPFESPFSLFPMLDHQPLDQFEIGLAALSAKVKSLYKMGMQKLLLDPFGLGFRNTKKHFKSILNLCRHIKLFQDQGLAIFAPIQAYLSEAQKTSFLTLALENKADCIQASDLIHYQDILKEY